jgi:hypothetical protein
VLRELGEDEPSVGENLEGSTARRHELDLAALEAALELGGQTVRLRAVVSLDAVFDPEAHDPDHRP